jgi:hypothetical protein
MYIVEPASWRNMILPLIKLIEILNVLFINIIRYWRIQRKLIENANSNNAILQTLQLYAVKYGLQLLTNTLQYTVSSCLQGIKSAHRRIKQEIIIQSNPIQSKAKQKNNINMISPVISSTANPQYLA